MTAQPVEHDDPLDPVRILAELPEDERGYFMAQYREAAGEAARDPAGWKHLRRILMRWAYHATAVKGPGYREALEAARRPVSESDGMLLEEAIRLYRPAS